MASEPINIPIKTTYDDEGAKDALRDAEKLDKLDPTVDVEVTADTDKATSGIDDVTQSARDLMDRNPWVAEVLADTAAAKSDLEGLQAKLGETGDKADDTSRHIDKLGHSDGPRIAGNQVADLTGPFGDASSAASNFGGVFDGLADIGEKVAGQIGLDAAAMASAISGIGFAVAGAAAVWSIFKQKQDEAKKKTAEHLKVQTDLVKAIQDGNQEVASAKFLELYGKVIDLGHKAGLSTNEIVDAIQGVGDAAPAAKRKIDDLNKQIDDLNASIAASPTMRISPTVDDVAMSHSLDALTKQRDALVGAEGEYASLTQKQKDNVQSNADVQDALFGTTGKLDDNARAADNAKSKSDALSQSFDTLRGSLDVDRAAQDFDKAIDVAMWNASQGVTATTDDVRALQDMVVTAAEQTGKTPIEVNTELEKITQGDLEGVRNDVDSWYRNNPVEIAVKAELDRASYNAMIAKLNAAGSTPSGPPRAGGTSVSTVNVNLPRGARHADIARAMNTATRRNGRRFANPVVHYARR